MKAKIAVLISGSGTNMAALLYAAKAADCPYEVVLVASNNPDAPGLALAAAEGVATFAHPHKGMTREAHDAVMHQALVTSGADYVALAGYMRILSEGFADQWAGRMLNIHPSLLPKYKGLHTHQRALEAGDTHGGCSVHLVTPGLDEGPVLAQTPVAVLAGDTEATLAARVLIAEHQLYARTLAAYVAREQDPNWLLDQVRALALALPQAEERESHGAPGWRIAGGKYFAYFNDRHHGHDAVALMVKTSGQDELAALCEQDPDLYFRPAYYGAAGWVGVRLDREGVDWAHVGEWLARSWRSVAPKKLAGLMAVAKGF